MVLPLFSRDEEPLLTGTDAAVQEFIDADRCIVIDWKVSEEDALWNVREWLPKGEFEYRMAPETGTGDITVTVRFRDREQILTLPPRPQNNFRILLWVGRILAPEYEIKLFQATEGDDTHAFLLRSGEWWKAFRDRYPDRYTSIFSDLEPLTRLWELEAPSKLLDSEAPTSLKSWWKLW